MNHNDMPHSGALVAAVFVGLCCLSNRRSNSYELTACPAHQKAFRASAADAKLESHVRLANGLRWDKVRPRRERAEPFRDHLKHRNPSKNGSGEFLSCFHSSASAIQYSASSSQCSASFLASLARSRDMISNFQTGFWIMGSSQSLLSLNLLVLSANLQSCRATWHLREYASEHCGAAQRNHF